MISTMHVCALRYQHLDSVQPRERARKMEGSMTLIINDGVDIQRGDIPQQTEHGRGVIRLAHCGNNGGAPGIFERNSRIDVAWN